METNYTPGQPVTITKGKYAGRTGIFKRYCSVVFAEFCSIILDLKARERTNKTIMTEHAHIAPITP